jgi:hypothetical protein
MDDPADAALFAYYARGEERDRLAGARGMVEFERTKQIVLRRLPAPPSVVADVGGGPGRYALWLAERGHLVEHRDLVPLHVEQLRAAAGAGSGISTAVGDAACWTSATPRWTPCFRDLVPDVERTGWMPPLAAGSFSAYCHRPQQLRAELRWAGFQVVDLVGVEGLAFALDDLDERVPELLGIGPHLLATGVRPAR